MTVVTSKRPARILLGVVLIGHSLLISFQMSHRIDTSLVRGWLLDSLAPLEMLIDRTLHGTGSIWSRYFALIGVYDENRRLQETLDDLRIQLNRQHEDVLEAERLRKLLDLDESGAGKRVAARVIGRDPTHSHRSLTIDKGLAHGIHLDSAVMTPQGIVGRVIEAGNYYSVVQLILDSQSGVGVLVLPDRRLGVIKGNGGGELDLDYIDDDTEIKVGDEVITSGQDRIYPKGLPVGVISSVGPRRGLFKTVRIHPRVDFGRLEELLCIIEKPEAVDVDPMDRPSMAPNP
jgi:rod shape-determining protein MreC